MTPFLGNTFSVAHNPTLTEELWGPVLLWHEVWEGKQFKSIPLGLAQSQLSINTY